MDFGNQQAVFKNRTDAGKKLGKLLEQFKGSNIVIYALPRGGVVVAAEVAKMLNSPLDLIITRKIGHPSQPEYAIGAVAENGHSIFNKEEVSNVDKNYLTAEAERQKEEAKRRRRLYLGDRKPIQSAGETAILVDDGIATGLTIKAAIRELKSHYYPKQIIVAVPVAPAETAKDLKEEGAEFVAVNLEKNFLGAIGAYYQNFSPVEDKDVIRIMKEAES